MKSKIKIIISVLFVIFVLCAIVGLIKHNNNPKMPNTNNDPQDNPPSVEPTNPIIDTKDKITDGSAYNDEYKGVAFLTEQNIDNFSSIDYNQKLVLSGSEGTDYKVSIQDNKIKYEYTSNLGENKIYYIENVPNIKSIRIVCSINGCDGIYALSIDSYLYFIPLEKSIPTENSKNIIKEKIDNASDIGIYDSYNSYIVYDSLSTHVVVKYNDNSQNIIKVSKENKFVKYPIDLEQRKFLTVVGGSIKGVSVYSKSNYVNTFTYQKDKSGNNIVVSLILTIYLPQNNKNSSSISSVIALTNENELYYIEGTTNNDKCVKFNDKKVEKFSINKNQITFYYTDSTKENYSFYDKIDLYSN